MSKKIFELHGLISLKGIEAVNKHIKDITKEAKISTREFVKLGHSVEKVGLTLTKISAGLVLFGAAITKYSADFENSMQQTFAVTDRLTNDLKQEMKLSAREVAKDSKYMAKEVADAMYWLGSAGYKAQDQIKLMPIVTQFATAGLLNLSQATDFLIGSQNALGLKSDDVNENLKSMTLIADTLTKANNMAFGSVMDFSEALTNKAAAAMRLYNIPLHEGVAALAVYATQNRKGKEAGESYAIVIRDLQRAAIKNADAFKKQGIAVFDSNGNLKSLSGILEQLEKRMAGMTDINKRVLFDLLGFQDKSISATMALLGTSQEMKRFEGEFANLNGETKKVADTMMGSFSNQLLKLKNNFIDIGLQLGEDFLPFLRDDLMPLLESLAKNLGVAAKKFSELNPSIKSAIMSFGILFVTLAPVVLVLGKIIALAPTLVIGFKAVAAAVGSLTAVFGLVTVSGAAQITILRALLKNMFDFKKAIVDKKEITNAELQLERMQTKAKQADEDTKRRKNSMLAANKRLQALNKANAQEELMVDEEALKKAKELADFNRSYQEKMLELEGDAIALNKIKWKEALKEAKEKGADIHAVNTYYGMLEDNIRAEVREKYKKDLEEKKLADKKVLDEINKNYKIYKNQEMTLLDEQLDKDLLAAGENEEAKLKILEMYLAKRKELLDKAEKTEYKTMEESIYSFKEKYDMIAGFVLNIANSISSLMVASVETWKKNTEKNIDATYETEKKAIENSVSSESTKKTKLEKLEKKHADKKAQFEEEYIMRKRKAQRAAALAEKANAIISSTIATALAVVKSLPNIPLAVIVGALGAIQTGLIAAQPMPELASGALVTKRKGGIQAIIGEGNQDEVVFPLETGIEQMATKLINKLSAMDNVNGKPLPSFGGSSNTSETNNNSSMNINIGTLIGDESSFRELWRRLEPYSIAEAQRKGI